MGVTERNLEPPLDRQRTGLTNELQSELFRDNLRRYLDGEPLVNELDKKLLY